MIFLLAVLACDTPDRTPIGRGDVPAVQAPAPRLKRLTATQYTNSMRALFGDDIVLPTSLDADERIEGLYAVGSAYTTISSYGVEKYEGAAYDIVEQVMDDDGLRATWVPCSPEGVSDDACAEQSLSTLGRIAWRRPLDSDELSALVTIAGDAAVTLDDFHEGLVYGMAAVLLSPNFLYRVEIGDGQTYDDWEIATRLSFFLWNSLPDDELLDAAEAGDLTDDAGLMVQVDRMLADPRAVEGVRNLFIEMLHLDELEGVSKDPTVYTYMSDELGDSALEETLLTVQALVFEDEAPYPELYTTQRTFIDRRLAAIYDVPAPQVEGFGEIWLDDDGGRRGFLGNTAFLALNAHAVSTSATRRGIFVREVVLCQTIPEPPADANTAIPEADADAPTMRERIASHLEDPLCASCHQITDPIGLGFENFDGIARWRTVENGATIDPSGELDGVAFADAWDLGQVVADHPNTGPCMAQTALQYATGTLGEELDDSLLQWHATGFQQAGHPILWLLRDVALSPAFRQSAPPSEELDGATDTSD